MRISDWSSDGCSSDLQDLRAPDRLAELDLPAPERRRRPGRAQTLRHRPARGLRPQARLGRTTMALDYTSRIPNNVDLSDNRRLQRALEDWQTKFLDWWQDMGPAGLPARGASRPEQRRDGKRCVSTC